ncbi:elongation factor P maturation arginine rhamnosyltransferase EarP [Shewanella maritima]|uniref:elongation factor P maturation arginine rhamnosyltransferase EarP n=1 Tax=Shewanella maritima TaxID=2520507 RepID=UPI00373606D7
MTHTLVADQNGNDTQASTPQWDIFCVVVDNYGDIGVTWRLAKQLAAEYAITVNLWVDDLNSFHHILPEMNPLTSLQYVSDVNIIHWNKEASPRYLAGDVLVEAFACELPSQVIKKLIYARHNHQQPVWINLEYLSAESWVDGCHGLPSLQANGLNKWFFFPGFNEKTGGLLHETNLGELREKWQADESNKLRLFNQLGLHGIEAHHQVISLFSYETNILGYYISFLSSDDNETPLGDTLRPTKHLLVPQGKCLTSIRALLSDNYNMIVDEINVGDCLNINQLAIHIIPMTDQPSYDRLLWSCDINIVRGEDSFLRAQWAARPFIWHIYPQDEDYHLIKLNAFLDYYQQVLPESLIQNYRDLVVGFNCASDEMTSNNIDILQKQYAELLNAAQKWAKMALNQTDLASRLVAFTKSR